MALKAKINAEEHAKLPAHFQSEYARQADGSFLLAVEAIEGFALENVQGLKQTVIKTREERDAALKGLEAFKDLDPVVAREAVGKVKEMANWKPEDKVREQIGEIRRQMTEEHTKTLNEVSAKATKWEKAATKALLRGGAEQAIARHRGKPALLLAPVMEHLKIVEENGEPVVRVVDKAGGVRFSSSGSGMDPMSIEELVGTFTRHDDYKVAFEAPPASGTGAGGGGGNGRGHVISEADARDVQKYQAARAAAEKAGVSLQIVGAG